MSDEGKKTRRVLCIVWAPFSARMNELAAEIGGKKAIFTFLYGRMYFAPLRYTILFLRTMLLIARERPDVIYAQNPSVFCPMSCLPYCMFWRKKLVIDHHAVWSMKTFSTGFLSRTIRSLERFVVSRSYANTAPHPLWARELEKMGGRNVLTIFDYVGNNEEKRDERVREKYSQGRKFIALAPHGGHPLERIESEIEGARSINSLTLLLSGPPSKLKVRLSQIELGSNARYIGFLEREDYEKLKASVDLGLSITDEPYTISHSLLEFAASSVPAISSEQEAVRLLFGDSLLYVNSSKNEDVRTAIESMIDDPKLLSDFKERIRQCQYKLQTRREQEIEVLRKLLNLPES